MKFWLSPVDEGMSFLVLVLLCSMFVISFIFVLDKIVTKEKTCILRPGGYQKAQLLELKNVIFIQLQFNVCYPHCSTYNVNQM